jgi:hypothetical protein
MEEIYASETLVEFHLTTMRYIPEDKSIHEYRPMCSISKTTERITTKIYYDTRRQNVILIRSKPSFKKSYRISQKQSTVIEIGKGKSKR